jgi:hypothetical protein
MGNGDEKKKSVGVLLGFAATAAAPGNDKSRNFLRLLHFR